MYTTAVDGGGWIWWSDALDVPATGTGRRGQQGRGRARADLPGRAAPPL